MPTQEPRPPEAAVSAVPLAVLRMAVAMQVLAEAASWGFRDGVLARFQGMEFRPRYPLLPELPWLPGLVPYAFFAALLFFAVAVLIGWRTRVTAPILAVLTFYEFAYDASRYSDARFLTCMLCALTAFLPVQRALSADRDAGREKLTTVSPRLVRLLQMQTSILLIHSGLGQFRGDWIAGAPLSEWMRLHAPGWMPPGIPGSTVAAASAGADLFFGAAFWLAPLRPFLLPPFLVLQALDLLVWHVGSAPWLIAALSLSFAPEWVWRRAEMLRDYALIVPGSSLARLLYCQLGERIDRIVRWFDDAPLGARRPAPVDLPAPPARAGREAGSIAAAVWIAIQVLFPLRIWLHPEPPEWTGFGRDFSWRGQRHALDAELELSYIQPSRELEWPLDPLDPFPVPLAVFLTAEERNAGRLGEGTLRDLAEATADTLPARIEGSGLTVERANELLRAYEATTRLRLTPEQFAAVSVRPRLLQQYARRAAQVLERLLGEPVEVRCDLQWSLNHRPYGRRWPADVDLARADLERELLAVGLSTPLPDAEARLARAAEVEGERRRQREFELASRGTGRPPEPIKLPPTSEADERWIVERFGPP